MKKIIFLLQLLYLPIVCESPVLSIVCCGRNDNYGGNFLDRLCFFLRSADRFNVDTEIVLVEWNPVHSRPKLVDIIRSWNKVVKFKNTIRVIEVSKESHKRFCKYYGQVDTPFEFQEFPAKNVGFRNAKGVYIIQTNPDNFFTTKTISNIESLLSYNLNDIVTGDPIRIDVKPVDTFKSLIGIKDGNELSTYLIELDNHFTTNYSQGDHSPLGDFMLFKKEHVLRSKGFPEYPKAINHFEAPFMEKFFLFNIGSRLVYRSGISTYHFDHSRLYGGGVNKEQTDNAVIEGNKVKNFGCPQPADGRVTPENDENWGLASLPLTHSVIR